METQSSDREVVGTITTTENVREFAECVHELLMESFPPLDEDVQAFKDSVHVELDLETNCVHVTMLVPRNLLALIDKQETP